MLSSYQLGEALEKIRNEKHLSQVEVSENIHISPKTLSKWEHGESYPDLQALDKLSKLYNIPLEILLDDDAGVEKVIKPTDFREEPQQVREGKDSKRKKAIGIIVTLIVLVLVASIIAVVLTKKGKTTDISEIPGEEIELDSSGIELDCIISA